MYNAACLEVQNGNAGKHPLSRSTPVSRCRFPKIPPFLWEVLMSATDDKFYHPMISKRVEISPDLWMIRVNPAGEFKFAPWQYATLGVEGPLTRSERPYSIASSPHQDEQQFFVEL